MLVIKCRVHIHQNGALAISNIKRDFLEKHMEPAQIGSIITLEWSTARTKLLLENTCFLYDGKILLVVYTTGYEDRVLHVSWFCSCRTISSLLLQLNEVPFFFRPYSTIPFI